jgi:hypothetical protein
MEKVCFVAPCSHNHAAPDRSRVVCERIQGCHGKSVRETPPKCESTLRYDRYVKQFVCQRVLKLPQHHLSRAIISVLKAENASLAVV